MIWRVLYNIIGIPFIKFTLLIIGIFNKKVARGIKGRLGEGDRLRLARSRCNDDKKRIIVHCASAGELEGAIPLIQAINDSTNAEVLLTYYSPSAVERANKLDIVADHFYLPIDTPRGVKRLLDVIEPSMILFIKHDIWPNIVWMAKNRSIPTVLINGNFRPDSKRLKRIAIPFGRALLTYLSAIYTIARDDAHRFKFLAGKDTQVVVTGDTRFDRVCQRARDGREDQGRLAGLLEDNPTVVAGSTWPADEKILLESWDEVQKSVDNAVMILVPHEPTDEHILHIRKDCESLGYDMITLTDLENGADPKEIVVVDRVGVLAGLYGLGKIAYVGGAFGTGVHSVIEPAVFGIPVIFGPKHLMSHEARDLVSLGAAKSIKEPADIIDLFINALQDGKESLEMGSEAASFVQNKSGVAVQIAKRLAKLAEL